MNEHHERHAGILILSMFFAILIVVLFTYDTPKQIKANRAAIDSLRTEIKAVPNAH